MYAKVIASFLLICLAAVSGGPNAFERAPAATVGGGTTPNLTETERHGDPNTHETVAALDPAEPSFKSPNQTEPFGLNAVLVEGGELLTKWNGVEADVRAENEILARCLESAEPCPRAAQKFLAIIADGRAHNGRSRIGVVNRAINLAIRPMSDLAQWGVPDRWSAPLATLTTGQGDCEDYAITKIRRAQGGRRCRR